MGSPMAHEQSMIGTTESKMRRLYKAKWVKKEVGPVKGEDDSSIRG